MMTSRGYDRLRGERGLARRDAGEHRALLEPGGRRRVAPQGLPLRVGRRPADRHVVGIDGEIVRGEQLDPVAVGVADIEKERVGYAVAAGAARSMLARYPDVAITSQMWMMSSTLAVHTST